MKKQFNQVALLTTALVVIILFIAVSYLIQDRLAFLKDTVLEYGYLGLLIYFFVTILVVVFAPLTALPLIPLLSSIYGWQLTALVSIVGWATGALIAFAIARKYGKPVVKKFASMEKIEEIECYMPKRRIFFLLVLLRISIPIDVLDYALGLFTRIDYKMFILTTIIGTAPIAIALSYFGTLPILFQIIGLSTGLLIMILTFEFTIWQIKIAKEKNSHLANYCKK